MKFLSLSLLSLGFAALAQAQPLDEDLAAARPIGRVEALYNGSKRFIQTNTGGCTPLVTGTSRATHLFFSLNTNCVLYNSVKCVDKANVDMFRYVAGFYSAPTQGRGIYCNAAGDA
ncbi:hypothetical protein [Absidia glauca]|uniref:Uncharacterized protein n=1 Tax=Absidia glauca TaxID=4829 RepID=A0A168KTU6_ABSGL|nr:hypothetical protein [Absidia glauca]